MSERSNELHGNERETSNGLHVDMQIDMQEANSRCGKQQQSTTHNTHCTPSVERMCLAERYKIYNCIDQFQPFQLEIMEKVAELNKVAFSVGTGLGKTTAIKYLSLDFIDLNPSNRCLIVVNTRALTYDIHQSINEILEPDEMGLMCNLCDYDVNYQINKKIIDKARIFITVPDKYMSLAQRLPRDFIFVSIDEIDALIDRNCPTKSSVIKILETIKYEYSIICSASMNDDVYTHIIYAFDFNYKTFNVSIPKIEMYKIRFDKRDRNWYANVCDRIHHIILEYPLANKVLVFCNYRNDCDHLYTQYKGTASNPNYCIHGGMSGPEIQDLLKQYKQNGKVLFTTDMCQRGLDIKDIDIVFHVGVIGTTDFYHRNGRTLRKGDAKSICFLFVQDQEEYANPSLKTIPEKKFEFRHNNRHDGDSSSSGRFREYKSNNITRRNTFGDYTSSLFTKND
jgi:superfamily II DNA/RNA helicase